MNDWPNLSVLNVLTFTVTICADSFLFKCINWMQKPIKCQRKANFFVVNQSPYSDIFDTETMQIVCMEWRNQKSTNNNHSSRKKPKTKKRTNNKPSYYCVLIFKTYLSLVITNAKRENGKKIKQKINNINLMTNKNIWIKTRRIRFWFILVFFFYFHWIFYSISR